MQNKAQDQLSSFMKKQADSKSEKHSKQANQSMKAAENNPKSEDEAKEAEELEEAKKEAMSQAANFNQTMMIRKLMIQTIVKYVAMILALVVVFFAIINVLPAFFHFVGGLIYKLFTGDFTSN